MTGAVNLTMPLLRYDTDDMAVNCQLWLGNVAAQEVMFFTYSQLNLTPVWRDKPVPFMSPTSFRTKVVDLFRVLARLIAAGCGSWLITEKVATARYKRDKRQSQV